MMESHCLAEVWVGNPVEFGYGGSHARLNADRRRPSSLWDSIGSGRGLRYGAGEGSGVAGGGVGGCVGKTSGGCTGIGASGRG